MVFSTKKNMSSLFSIYMKKKKAEELPAERIGNVPGEREHKINCLSKIVLDDVCHELTDSLV